MQFITDRDRLVFILCMYSGVHYNYLALHGLSSMLYSSDSITPMIKEKNIKQTTGSRV